MIWTKNKIILSHTDYTIPIMSDTFYKYRYLALFFFNKSWNKLNDTLLTSMGVRGQ